MTIRQMLRRLAYPMLMLLTKLKKNNGKITRNVNNTKPIAPFHSLQTFLNNGNEFHFSSLRDKKVLIVNTASDCGFTDQYKELEELYKRYRNRLVVLAFPSNDFGQQEKGNDEMIMEFCRSVYGIDFPIMQKSVVINGEQQNPVFNWLTHAAKNGWNNKAPQWNFSKYLVNKEGILTHCFVSSISPLSKEVLNALNE